MLRLREGPASPHSFHVIFIATTIQYLLDDFDIIEGSSFDNAVLLHAAVFVWTAIAERWDQEVSSAVRFLHLTRSKRRSLAKPVLPSFQIFTVPNDRFTTGNSFWVIDRLIPVPVVSL